MVSTFSNKNDNNLCSPCNVLIISNPACCVSKLEINISYEKLDISGRVALYWSVQFQSVIWSMSLSPSHILTISHQTKSENQELTKWLP